MELPEDSVSMETCCMAEITMSACGKRQKPAPKVDLTPMVDLGFLLVSFFVFTTTLFEPKILSLIMPDPGGPPTKVPESGAVTIIASGQYCYYYEGDTPEQLAGAVKFSGAEMNSMRLRILQLKQQLIQANGDDEKLMVMIKMKDDAALSQLVELLDEMSICDVRRYSIAELNDREKNW